MDLQARLTLEDLSQFLAEFTPVRFEFAPEQERERYLALDPPKSVTLVAGAGLRIETSASIHWSLALFTVPITLPHVTVLLRPSIEKSPTLDRGCLAFHLEVEAMDVANLPSFVDKALMQKVNDELRHTPLRWDFGKTLSHTFELPPTLPPVTAIALTIEWGEARVADDGVFLTVSIHAGVVRREDSSARPAR